jgi:hypothetical protein
MCGGILHIEFCLKRCDQSPQFICTQLGGFLRGLEIFESLFGPLVAVLGMRESQLDRKQTLLRSFSEFGRLS